MEKESKLQQILNNYNITSINSFVKDCNISRSTLLPYIKGERELHLMSAYVFLHLYTGLRVNKVKITKTQLMELVLEDYSEESK